MQTTMLKRYRSRKHKLLLVLPTLIALAFAGFAAWLQIARSIPTIDLPVAVLPSPNGFDTLAAAGKAYVAPVKPVDALQETNVPQPQVKAKIYPLAARQAWLAQNKKAVSLLRLSLKQEYQSPVGLIDGPRFTTFSSSRELARLLVVESRVRGELGDWSGAAQSAVDVIHMGRKVGSGGVLIDTLVGVSITAIGRQRLWDVLPHLNAGESLYVAQRLQTIETEKVVLTKMLASEQFFHFAF